MNFRQLCHRSAKTAFTTFSLDDAEEVGSRGGGDFTETSGSSSRCSRCLSFDVGQSFPRSQTPSFGAKIEELNTFRVYLISEADAEQWGAALLGRKTFPLMQWRALSNIAALNCFFSTYVHFILSSPQASSPQTQKNSITFLSKYNM